MFVRNGYLYIIRMMCITRLNIECRYHFVIGHDSIFTFRHSLSPDSCVMRFIRTVFYAETQFFRPSQSDRVIFPGIRLASISTENGTGVMIRT